jgi:hypothetical protein
VVPWPWPKGYRIVTFGVTEALVALESNGLVTFLGLPALASLFMLFT